MGPVCIPSGRDLACPLPSRCLPSRAPTPTSAEGKLFDLQKNKKAKEKQRQLDAVNSAIAAAPTVDTAAPAAPAAAAIQTSGAPAAPAPDGSPAPEIVAAIAAAVCALEGEGTVIRGIRRLPAAGSSRRGVWGDAGVAANVRPF